MHAIWPFIQTFLLNCILQHTIIFLFSVATLYWIVMDKSCGRNLYSLWEKLLVLAFIWKVTFCQAQSQFLDPVSSKIPFYVDFYVDSLPEELDSKKSIPFLDNLVYPWLLSIRRGLLLCHISDAGIIKIILCVYQLWMYLTAVLNIRQ